MQIAIRNRYSGAIIIVIDVDCDDDTSMCVAKGMAVQIAHDEGVDFHDADLSFSKLRSADLSHANFHGADFRHCILDFVNFTDSCLRSADLRESPMTGADLRRAKLWRHTAVVDQIHQRVWAACSKPGALNMDMWHTCDTTHCQAGWVVHLAGDAGKALEWHVGTQAAAAMIYMASDPDLEAIPDFYATYDEALRAMWRLADAEAARAAIEGMSQ